MTSEAYYPDGEPEQDRRMPGKIKELQDKYRSIDDRDVLAKVAVIDQMIELVPYSPHLYYARGTLFIAAAKDMTTLPSKIQYWGAAKNSLLDATALDPDFYEAWLELAAVLCHQGNFEEALRVSRNCVSYFTKMGRDASTIFGRASRASG